MQATRRKKTNEVFGTRETRDPTCGSHESQTKLALSPPAVLSSGCKMNTAVQLWDGQLSVITTPIPHVSSSNEVLVKVAFSGICGTDLHIIAGEFPSAKCVILGHEFAGVVSEIGSQVKGISVGDR